jgi:small subunit ribosomal protein S3
MGHKTNPIANRIGYIRGWEGNWFAKKHDFAQKLHEDTKIRRYFEKEFASSIARVLVARASESITLTVHTSRPGILIGPGGQKVQEIKKDLKKLIGKDVRVNVFEIKVPELNATLVAKSIATQISARSSYKRAAARALEDAMHVGAKGIKIEIGGRLNGVEIARTVSFKKGRIPTQTLRADVDFARARANTTYGVVGVKVWLFTNEVYGKRDLSLSLEAATTQKRSPRRR